MTTPGGICQEGRAALATALGARNRPLDDNLQAARDKPAAADGRFLISAFATVRKRAAHLSAYRATRRQGLLACRK